MLWVDTDNPHHTLAVNHLALITNLFDGRTYLHYKLSISFIPVSYPAHDSNRRAITPPTLDHPEHPEEFE